MTAKSRVFSLVALTAGALLTIASVVPVAAQAQSQTQKALGTARIPAGVVANGQPLPAGTYSVRLSTDPVAPVVGQGADAAKWVEFVQAGQVKGKELASVVSPADVKAVAKRTPPAPGAGMVQTLNGADYVRVWFNSGGTQYLVHLTRAAK
jgi:hypothetical protein